MPASSTPAELPRPVPRPFPAVATLPAVIRHRLRAEALRRCRPA